MKPTTTPAPLPAGPGASPVPLESVLFTEDLLRRPWRPPDYQTENRALTALAKALAGSPDTILKTLTDTILEVLQAGSAGMSLLDEGGKQFYWPAIAGSWKPYVGGGTPRDFGPCGDVLDRDAPLLFKHVERRYTYLLEAAPAIEEALLVPFHVQGKAVGTLWAITHDQRRRFDAEDLRQLESLARFAGAAYQAAAHAAEMTAADHRKNEFLAMLAHELRNPLAPIRSALHVLWLTDGQGEAVRAAAEMMDRQVGQMVRLVDDLLDISRVGRGKIELRRGRTELAPVVRQAVEASRDAIESARHELTVTLPPEPVYLDADPARLAQVIGNLLHNACKFTREGGRIGLAVERQEDQAVIRVQDSGIGIAADALGRVFDLFMQVDSTLERTASGLGLGLTLVKSLVELHGGTVEAHSAGLGQGSEFVVRLPILAAAAPADVPPPQPAATEPTATRPLRILVVDDNQDAAESLVTFFEMTGEEPATARDGLEAVAAAEWFRPDVVLLDIGLPVLNGYEACRRIREQPWGREMMLVALTGWGQEEDRRKSKEVGFDHHVVKPVDPVVLLSLLRSRPGPVSPR